MNFRIVGIISENFRQMFSYSLDHLRRRKVQIDGYAEIQQWAFINCAFFNRKKRRVVRTHVKEICCIVTHVNSPSIRRCKQTNSSIEYLFLLFEQRRRVEISTMNA